MLPRPETDLPVALFSSEETFFPRTPLSFCRQMRYSVLYEARLFDPHLIFMTSFDICRQNEGNSCFARLSQTLAPTEA